MDVLHESRHMSCATAESLLCDASVPARSRDEWKNPPFLPNWASTAGRPRASCPSPSPEKLFILFGLKYMQSDPLTSIPICICIVADFFLPKIIGCTAPLLGPPLLRGIMTWTIKCLCVLLTWTFIDGNDFLTTCRIFVDRNGRLHLRSA